MATQSKNRSLSLISDMQTPAKRAQAYVYIKNEKSHIISRAQMSELIAEITTNPQQSVRYYARKVGLNVNDVNVAVEKNQSVRKLARTGQIAVLNRGRNPDWYRSMALAQRMIVPVLDAEEQYEHIATNVFPTRINVEDEIVREDAEFTTTLFGMILARTNMSNASAIAFANEMTEIVQHQAENLANAKQEMQALAQTVNSASLRLTNSAANRIAAE